MNVYKFQATLSLHSTLPLARQRNQTAQAISSPLLSPSRKLVPHLLSPSPSQQQHNQSVPLSTQTPLQGPRTLRFAAPVSRNAARMECVGSLYGIWIYSGILLCYVMLCWLSTRVGVLVCLLVCVRDKCGCGCPGRFGRFVRWWGGL